MGRHILLPSPDLDRSIHLWAYGHWGAPLIVFPTAAGMAHEWDQQGMVGALWPWIERGDIKLYCVESNVAEAWTQSHSDPRWRIWRHHLYEQFVLRTLVPFVRHDCRSPDMRIGLAGASMGAMYASTLALKHPDLFWWALCLSGRYEVRSFTGGLDNSDVYFNNPLAFVHNLHGSGLEHARQTALTLVVGQGQWENNCTEETIALAQALRSKQIPHELDLWGHDVSHEWHWWRRQATHHIGRRFGGLH